jgi:hypothetical protein
LRLADGEGEGQGEVRCMLAHVILFVWHCGRVCLCELLRGEREGRVSGCWVP